MTLRSVLLAALALGALGRAASADDVVAYPVDGEADASADATAARVEALDGAFAKAAAAALDELVDPGVRKTNRAALDKEIIGHARLWVAKFSVTKDETVDGRRQLAVSVRVDRDKMRARLAELTIATRAAVAAPEAPPDESPTTGTATVLLSVARPSGASQSWGKAADAKLVGVSALAGVLRARASLAVVRAPATGPAARADANELPLDDAAAEALAADAKADVAAVAGVVVGEPQALRGVAAGGALVTAQLRVVDRANHRAVGQGRAVTAAIGGDAAAVDAAIDRALVSAAADVLPPAPMKLAAAQFTGPDIPVADAGVVLLRLPRTTPWGLVAAELKYLAGARGVSRATIRRVSPSGWVLGVATGESIDRVAAIAKKAPTADSSVTVRVAGSIVELALTGAP